MPLTAGEVEAVLIARDNMSPVMQLAAARVADLEYKLGTLGVNSVSAFNVMNAQLAIAKERLANLEAGNNTFSTSMNQVDSIATRLITRMAILYAVRETFSFIVDMFTAADAMVKLSDTTGITLGKLQELQYTADQIGVPFSKTSSILESFEKHLAQNKMATEDALESIGLSFSKIFAMSPDERITAVLTAIGKIPDAVVRARVELELFGTEGVDPLARKFAIMGKSIQDSNAILSDETVHALANTVSLYRGFWTDLKPIIEKIIDGGQRATAALAGVFMNPNTGGGSPNSPLPVTPVGDTPDVNVPKLPNGINVQGNPFPTGSIVDYIDKLKAAASGERALTDEQIAQMTELKNLNMLTEQNAALLTKNGVNLDINTAKFKQFVELEKQKEAGDKAAATASEHYWRALDELNSAGTNWQATLDEMNGAQVESIKWAMQAGIANKDLELVYEANAVQIHAVAAELKNENAERKIQAAATLEITKLSDELNQIVGDQGATAYQKQVNAIEKWSADLVAKMSKAGTDTTEFYDRLSNVVLAMYRGLAVDWKALSETATNDSKESLQQIADKAAATYTEALKHVGKWSDGAIDKFRQVRDAAQQAADNWGTAIVNNSAKALQAIDTVTKGFFAQIDAMNAANNAASAGLQSTTGTRAPHLENGVFVDGNGNPMSTANPTGFQLPGFKLPGFAQGGVVTVGEFGAERVALPSGSTVFPHGAGPGGSNVTVNVEMNVSGMLDPATIRNVSTEVSKAIMKEAKNSLPFLSR